MSWSSRKKMTVLVSFKIYYASVGAEILRIARTSRYLINMVKRVKLLSIWTKKQGSECTRIISLLKKMFGKDLKYFISLQKNL